MAEHLSSVDINASPETVFTFLVTDAGVTSWMGEWASLNPEPGGEFAVNIAGYAARGAFLEVDPPRRVTVSWGFVGHPDLPPGASTVSFELTPTTTGTRLDVVHTDLPEAEIAGHANGWNHFLSRLTSAAVGAPLPPDNWTPTLRTSQ